MIIRFVFLVFKEVIMEELKIDKKYALEVLSKLISYKTVLDEYKENDEYVLIKSLTELL